MDLVTELWKEIKGYEGLYWVSNLGRIKSIRTIRKTFPNKKGYLIVVLSKNNQLRSFAVHKLVANAFIPKVENKNHINHIDFNKTNNCVENLEWVSQKDNNKWSWQNGRCENTKKAGLKNLKRAVDTAVIVNSKPVYMYDKGGNFIKEFASIMEAERFLGIKKANVHISKCCKDKVKSAYGFMWKYAEEGRCTI